MNFSFVIPTGTVSTDLLTTIDYINAAVPSNNCEIILVGNVSVDKPNVKIIPFDESVKPKAWITRKKNLGAQEAKYENVVFLHDYIALNPTDWYSGWCEYGNNFEVAVNKILTMENFRHTDWVISPYDLWEAAPDLKDTYNVLMPYGTRGMNDVMYISGNYWVAKKDFMLSYPLDETLVWGDAEDVMWSKQIRKVIQFKCNVNSTVHIIKPNKWAPAIISNYALAKLKERFNVEPIYD